VFYFLDYRGNILTNLNNHKNLRAINSPTQSLDYAQEQAQPFKKSTTLKYKNYSLSYAPKSGDKPWIRLLPFKSNDMLGIKSPSPLLMQNESVSNS